MASSPTTTVSRRFFEPAFGQIQPLGGFGLFQEQFNHDHSIPPGKWETRKTEPRDESRNGCLIADMNGQLLSLAITAVIGLAAIVGFCWLMSSLLNKRDTWQSGGGAAFTPLQEMIQPQIRHVVEAQEQCVEEGDHGAPDS